MTAKPAVKAGAATEKQSAEIAETVKQRVTVAVMGRPDAIGLDAPLRQHKTVTTADRPVSSGGAMRRLPVTIGATDGLVPGHGRNAVIPCKMVGIAPTAIAVAITVTAT